jgi:hypothetical protein
VVKVPAVLLATVIVCEVTVVEANKKINAKTNLAVAIKNLLFIVVNSMLICGDYLKTKKRKSPNKQFTIRLFCKLDTKHMC